MNINTYLQRIHYMGSRNPTAETLRDLHRSHMLNVPFENLSIHSSERIQLDLEWLYDKIVTRRRGGFCYELNGLFGWLLTELGFSVEMLSARVARPDGSFGPDFDYIHKGVREETVFVNESVNNEIPEKKVCLGVYTPKHTFFSGVHTTVDQNSVREETLLIGTDQVQEAMEKHFDIIWKPKG